MKALALRVITASRWRIPILAVVTIVVAIGLACLAATVTIPLFAGIPSAGFMSTVAATAFCVALPVVLVLTWVIHRTEEQKRDLAAREELFTTAQRIGKLGYWHYDIANDRFILSENVHDLLGDPGKTLRMTSRDLMERTNPEDRERLSVSLTRIIEDGTTEQHEYRITGLDGVEKTFWVDGQRMLDASGKPLKAYGACQDITERKQIEAALRESEDHYRHAVELNPQIPWTADPEGSILEIGPRWFELVGMDRQEALGTGWAAALHPDDLERTMRSWSDARKSGKPVDIEYRLKQADGSYRWFRARAAARLDEAGEIVRWYGTLEDIHDSNTAHAALRESVSFASSILNSSPDCLCVVDLDGSLRFMNEPGLAAMEIEDFAPLKGRSWLSLWPDVLRADLNQAMDAARGGRVGRLSGFCPTAKGTPKWWDVTVSPIIGPDEEPDRLLVISRDRSAEKHAQEQLLYLAHHDPLTGLVNRSVLNEQLDRALSTSSPSRQTALLFLDLDEFKPVNDTLGHTFGDRVLGEVAERLRTIVRSDDTVARFGGDEFAIVARVNDQKEASALADRIIAELKLPFVLDDRAVTLGASIGLVMIAAPGPRPDAVLRDADIALYRAKAEGRGVCRLFEAEMGETVKGQQELKQDLRKALERGELFVQYQPLVDFATGRVTGFEALVRWNHPTRGLVSPCAFIPIAEEVGVILEIGEWVLAQACEEAASWPDALLVAVNLSPVQFRSGNLASTVERCLEAADLPASQLQLEITESVLLIDSETNIEALHALRRLGVSISMDDFGTGYSSLSYLRKFPFDKIKIDRGFVADLAHESVGSGEPRAIVQAIIELARGFGIRTTAEGVETECQARVLREMGCDEGQGYFYSKPIPAEGIPALINSRTRQVSKEL